MWLTSSRRAFWGVSNYIISAQFTVSDVTGETASVSGFYSIPVDRVVEFIDNGGVGDCSVVVEYRNLQFDTPAELRYGESIALRVKGEFVLNLGYIRNGSFENALSDWAQTVPPGAYAGSVPGFFDYAPIDGRRFALLSTDGPGSFTAIEQEFYANAGDAIRGWSFFVTTDYLPFDDHCTLHIISGGTVLNTPFRASVSSIGNRGKTPWTI